MHLRASCAAALAALCAAVAAQFTFPTASTRLSANEPCTVQWKTDGLQGPLSINLVRGDAAGGEVLENIAGESSPYPSPAPCEARGRGARARC